MVKEHVLGVGAADVVSAGGGATDVELWDAVIGIAG